MAAITAGMVAQLREKTGAGMMQCKQALTEADGDLDEAVKILRVKSAGKVGARAERTAAEGLVMATVSPSKTVGVLVEMNSETDFVARNEDFKTLARTIAQSLASYEPGTVPSSTEEFLQDTLAGGATVADTITEAAARIGEKIALGRWERFGAPDGNAVQAYVHNPSGSGDEGGKIGVMVEVTGGADAAALSTLAREIALHISSANPLYLTDDEVDAATLGQEREVALAQLQADPKMAGKPQQVLDNVVTGRVRKFLEEKVLLNQPYVREPGKTVGQLVKETSGASVVRFVRFRVGEEGGRVAGANDTQGARRATGVANAASS